MKSKIGKKYQAVGAVTQLGILGCDLKKWKDKTISSNPFFCPDKTVIKLWEKYLLGIRKAGSSCGAIIEIRARGVPLGLGAPIYSKLDMDLARSISNLEYIGAPSPKGTPLALISIIAPQDDPAFLIPSKYFSQSLITVLSGQKNGLLEIVLSFHFFKSHPNIPNCVTAPTA